MYPEVYYLIRTSQPLIPILSQKIRSSPSPRVAFRGILNCPRRFGSWLHSRLQMTDCHYNDGNVIFVLSLVLTVGIEPETF